MTKNNMTPKKLTVRSREDREKDIPTEYSPQVEEIDESPDEGCNSVHLDILIEKYTYEEIDLKKFRTEIDKHFSSLLLQARADERREIVEWVREIANERIGSAETADEAIILRGFADEIIKNLIKEK